MTVLLLLIFFGLVGICTGSCMWFDDVDSIWTPVIFFGGLLSMAIGIISIIVFL